MSINAIPVTSRRVFLHLSLLVTFIAAAALVLPYDAAISGWARTWSGPGRELIDELVGILRLFGRGEVAILVALLVGALGWRRQTAEILVALVIVAVVVTAVKHGVARLRPNGSSGYAFPSGDAATAAALFVPLLAGRLRRLPWVLLAVAGVCYGRLHQGYHYPSDVAAGCVVGCGASWIAQMLLARRIRFPGSGSHVLVAMLFVACYLAFSRMSAHSHGGAGELGRFLVIFAPVLVAAMILRYHRALRYWARVRRLGITPLGWVTLAGMALCFLIWMTTRSSLWDRDEPRYATASMEMVQSGDLLVPTFNGEPRLGKPAGIYWLMAPVMKLGGAHEWAARLPAVLATLLSACMTWLIGLRLRDQATGLYAAAVVLATPLVLVSGTAATTDAVLLALITAGTAVLVNALVLRDRASEARLGWLGATGLACIIGFAFLVKGPLAPLPILIALIACLVTRHSVILATSFWWRLAFSAVGSAVIALAWFIPANQATHGAYYHVAVGKNLIQRGREAMESHHGGPWYYLLVIMVAFFPWSAFLPLALASFTRWSLLARAVLCAWILPLLVVLSCYATKLPSYILPLFPALALMVALVITARGDGPPNGAERRWFRCSHGILMAISLSIALACLLAPWLRLLPGALWSPGVARALEPLSLMDGLLGPAVGLALVFVLMARCGGRAVRDGRLRQAAAVMFTTMIACAWSLGLAGLPAIERYKASRPMARAINAVTPPTIPVWVADYDEPSLHFYLQRGPLLPIADTDVALWARQPGEAVLVLSRQLLKAAQANGLGGVREITPDISGINLANGHWVDLVAVARGL